MVLFRSQFEYQVGGSLDGDAPSYVTRPADSIFYEALHAGRSCHVLNSRQMGKSSLRARTMRRLQSAGKTCIFVDLTGIGASEMTPEKWYAGFVYSLVSGCHLADTFSWQVWWRQQRDLLAPAQRLRRFIEEILLGEIDGDIVIFVDEIDRVLSQNFSLDDFFALLRFFDESRAIDPVYRRLTFALLGVAAPWQLIRDRSRNPSNIGMAIELRGFGPDEIAPLAKGLQGKVSAPEKVLAEILEWTGGQPFLTQKLCQQVLRSIESDSGPLSIERIVREKILDNWEARDEPEHLRTIRDRILRDPSTAGRLLEIYGRILLDGSIAAEDSLEQKELRLSGLVVEREGRLLVYNRVYATVFNAAWVDRQLAGLRPYHDRLSAWLDSEDEFFLLRGQELQDALAWALGKSLGDTDYRYLVASQDLARRQIQDSLDATERAGQLLASTVHRARQEIARQPPRPKRLAAIALGVTGALLSLRFAGFLQRWEWDAIDRFTRWRSAGQPPETRVAVVTIDETDIQRIGRWPVPDRQLADAIARIEAANPRAIGLDLYRDLPVEPGYRDLARQFSASDRLFGIEKAVEPTVAPPDVLREKQRVGFADQIVDADGKVRRALLSIGRGDEVRASLAVELALHYLQRANISLESIDADRYRLGKAVFDRFEKNDGGYIRANNMGGYQIWLDYRGTAEKFPTFTLRQLLDGQVPPALLEDRVVLIGMAAESSNDFFNTPYNSGPFDSGRPLPGVFLHANIVSQILSAALDGRPLSRSLPEAIEGLWILLWAGAGVSIGRYRKLLPVALLSLTGGLVGGCYLAFLHGWWLPLVPAALALGCTSALVPIITWRVREKQIFRRVLNDLLAIARSEPFAGRLAIEYLKRSESAENQAEIERQLAGQPEKEQP